MTSIGGIYPNAAAAVTVPKTHTTGTTSGTDTYTMTSGLSLVEADLDGMSFSVSFGNANTGVASLDIDSIGPKSINKEGTTSLAASDLIAGRMYTLAYDGTNFQVQNVISSGGGGVSKGQFVFKDIAGITSGGWNTFTIGIAPFNGTITSVIVLVEDVAITASDSAYWRFIVGVDTDQDSYAEQHFTLNDGSSNTTKITSGSNGLTAWVPFEVPLTATSADLDFDAGDQIVFTPYKQTSPETLTKALCVVTYIPR